MRHRMGIGEFSVIQESASRLPEPDVMRIFALQHAYEIGRKLSKREYEGRAPSATL